MAGCQVHAVTKGVEAAKLQLVAASWEFCVCYSSPKCFKAYANILCDFPQILQWPLVRYFNTVQVKYNIQWVELDHRPPPMWSPPQLNTEVLHVMTKLFFFLNNVSIDF